MASKYRLTMVWQWICGYFFNFKEKSPFVRSHIMVQPIYLVPTFNLKLYGNFSFESSSGNQVDISIVCSTSWLVRTGDADTYFRLKNRICLHFRLEAEAEARTVYPRFSSLGTYGAGTNFRLKTSVTELSTLKFHHARCLLKN